jgi:hypothetical protein
VTAARPSGEADAALGDSCTSRRTSLTLPVTDFDQAFSALKSRSCPRPMFYWLPWSNLSSQLVPEPATPHAFVVTDLLRYLSEEGLVRFNGWAHACFIGAAWRYARPESRAYWRGPLDKPFGSWRYHQSTSKYWNVIGGDHSVSLPNEWTYTKGG